MAEMKEVGLRLRAVIRLFRRLAARRWRSLSLAHKLAPLGILAGIAAVFLSRNRIGRLWSALPARIGDFFLYFSHNHPHLARIAHVGLNVIPDTEFVVLALAGLVYLMPSLIDRIEKKRALRITVTVAFVTFGILTVAVNAINREEEDYTKSQLSGTISDQGKKRDAVNTTNGQILQYLVSNKTMSEADRRESILKVLRNEYIASHEPIDPQILAGNQMPPADWTNQRLATLGEHWKVAEVKPPAPIIQQAPEPKKANVEFGFFSGGTIADNLTVVRQADFSIVVPFTFHVTGDVTAHGLNVWIRLCTVCSWKEEPPGFRPPDKNTPQDRTKFVGDFNPGPLYTPIEVHIGLPSTSRGDVAISGYFSCDNCHPETPDTVQHLLVHVADPMPPDLSAPYIPIPAPQ